MRRAYQRAEQLAHEAYTIGAVFNRYGAELHRDLR